MQELFLANLVCEQLVLGKQGSKKWDLKDVLEDLADRMQPARVNCACALLSLVLKSVASLWDYL